ncbi:MAG: elongation factor Ts [Alphaproteobacteria bacterium]|nr:elongation factor Ts [Alphaproteobacteria bacterium]
MTITASMVKELRGKTGAGMMDCKNALKESDGDIEASVDWLRKKGLSQAAKKSGRVAAEGLVSAISEGVKGAIVEVNSETDFVARNEDFQSFVSTIASATLSENGDIEAVQRASYPETGRSVAEELTNKIATIGENMSIRRCETLSVENGAVVPYVHGALAPGLGKIGVLVALESTGDKAVLESLGKQLAMHVAAALPQCVSRDDVSPEELERERNILTEQARDSGRPEEIIVKMVEGRLRKYFEESVLLEQVFVVDNETRISKVLENAAKEAGAPITVTGFVRFALGEGIEKVVDNLADEVAATLAG